MGNWIVEDVARHTKGALIGTPNLEVSGCIIDSRQAQGGEMCRRA